MNYYYYIAGMPDVAISNPKAAPDPEALRAELEEQLSAADLRLFRLLADRTECPEVKAYIDRAEADTEAGLTREQREGLYYEYGMKSRNRFVSRWFEFNLNLNNILTAFVCRKNNWDIRRAIVGQSPVAEAIRRNPSVRDFNLTAELDYMDDLRRIAETENLMEREQHLDALKWQWLDQNTFFHYFSIERILAFYLKTQLMQRWNMLTVEEGERAFRSMIDKLKKDVTF